jgi:hypothetical protein
MVAAIIKPFKLDTGNTAWMLTSTALVLIIVDLRVDQDTEIEDLDINLYGEVVQ